MDAWLDAALPKRPFSPIAGDPEPNPDERAFRAGAAARHHGFFADLGLLEGEAIRRRDGRFGWAVNRLPDFADTGSYGRVCLIKPGDGVWAATVLELDAHMLAICHPKMAPRGNRSGHRFGDVLAAALARAFDPA